MSRQLDRLIERVGDIHSVEKATNLLFDTCSVSDRVVRALEIATEAHKGQARRSGEPYIVHPILVATITAAVSDDETMVIAALLHDVVEDTKITLDEVRDFFDDDVALIVNGLTKIVRIRDSELPPSGSDEKLITHALSFRNMLVTSVKDVRVLVIKLCDRLHNLLTLYALTPAKQHRIAEESLVVYAPIAHRLGIAALKKSIEDVSFYYLFPTEFGKIDSYLQTHKEDINIKLNTFISSIKTLLVHGGMKVSTFEVFGRIKHNYSIYMKMQRKGVGIDEVLDLLAVRILVQEPIDCYRVLGILHLNFKPLISRFKDYVAIPKENGYQTLHTTLFDDSSIFEAQIRTYSMHKTAEYGIAAHWKYKQTVPNVNTEWLQHIGSQSGSVEEFVELAQYDLYSEDITVFTPDGDGITLPRAATVLDFAYAVHTEIGDRANAAFVNKQPTSLLAELHNGDIVRVHTDSELIYHCSWIDAVKTSRAKNAMRAACRQRIREIDSVTGLNILSTVLGIGTREVDAWLKQQEIEENCYRIPKEDNYLKEVIKRYTEDQVDRSAFFPIFKKMSDRLKTYRFENLTFVATGALHSVEFDYCCHPKHGDPIMAFRYGGSAIVHHKFCDKAFGLMKQNRPMLHVHWSKSQPDQYRVLLSLRDHRGVLAALFGYLAKHEINVVSLRLGHEQRQSNYCEMVVEAKNMNLKRLSALIEKHNRLIEINSLDDAYKRL